MTKHDRVRPIGKFTNHKTGEVICMPDWLEAPDTAETLEADGLIIREYDDDGNWIATLVPDAHDLRVLSWQLTMNAKCARLGIGVMFKNMPIDVINDEPQGHA